ncbi:unnamed protein product [Moneuplotes crassus]|uniref:Uncharacterized protein n=3 Tax=Euplotes crassus TaxID=5936 RepID=A0AAD1XSC5_EUPCR|nr:unnamed protein product [Moneuplotes crassus]
MHRLNNSERFVDHVNYNPAMSNHFWQQRLEREDSHKFTSTIKGLEMGRVSNIPVTDKFKRSLSNFQRDDPFMVAKALKDESRSPMVNKIKYAPSSTLGSMRGIRCYDNDSKPRWMNSSIDLSQPKIFKLGTKPSVQELNTTHNFNIKDIKPQKSAGFVPMVHPYAWKPKKIINPIKNNTLARTSDNINLKVTEVSHSTNQYQKKHSFKDPRARASELLQNAGKQFKTNSGYDRPQKNTQMPTTTQGMHGMNQYSTIQSHSPQKKVRYG